VTADASRDFVSIATLSEPPSPLPENAPARPTAAVALAAEVAQPADPPGWLSIAEEVERALRILLADDSGGRHSAALERLQALDPVAVANEVVYQFDALTPVGPLAPTRVDEVWEELRRSLCRSPMSDDDRAALPAELGCRPPPARP
jgi:hypothetical protein